VFVVVDVSDASTTVSPQGAFCNSRLGDSPNLFINVVSTVYNNYKRDETVNCFAVLYVQLRRL